MSIPTKLVVFPDIEAWTMTTLRAALPSYFAKPVRVADKYDPNAVEEYQVIPRRDGGPQLDVVRELNRMNLNLYGTGDLETELVDLARIVSAVLRHSADGNPVVRVVQISGPLTVPDSMPRRLLSLEVTARGTELTPIP